MSIQLILGRMGGEQEVTHQQEQLQQLSYGITRLYYRNSET